MDEDTKQLLESWQLSSYIPIFAENKITLDTLGLLDSHLIKELIKPVGDRARFSKNLAEWNNLTNSLSCNSQDKDDDLVTKLRHPTVQDYQEIFGVDLAPNESLCSTPVNTPDKNYKTLNDTPNLILVPSITNKSTSQEICLTSDSYITSPESPSSASSLTVNSPHNDKYARLEYILNSSLEGKGLLNLYSKSGLLSNNGRRKICNIIVKHILEKDPLKRISSSTLLRYAEEIRTLFRKENISTYFVPYLSNTKLKIRRLTKGKLYDCLQNRKREYREAFKTKENIKENLPTKTVNYGNQNPAEVIEDIIWLKNSSDPWALVTEKWYKTVEFRHAEIMKESSTVESYMKTYPALQKPAGFHLLVSDFAYQYPESTENFKENFPLYKEKILDLTVTKFSKHLDQGVKGLTEEYMNTIKEESSNSVAESETTSIYALMFLPLLLGNPVSKSKKKCWRPSKQEVRDTFITHVKAEVDLKEVITRRKEKYLSFGLTFQPTIFIVGPSINCIKNYYIVVNDIFYVVNSIVDAVDVTFKLFHSLHCEYPTECYIVYSFLQKGFYKLNTKWDKEFTSVNALLADLDIK